MLNSNRHSNEPPTLCLNYLDKRIRVRRYLVIKTQGGKALAAKEQDTDISEVKMDLRNQKIEYFLFPSSPSEFGFCL